MRKTPRLLALAGLILLGSAAMAQQSTGKTEAPRLTTAAPVAAGKSPYRPVATVKNIMETMIDPASDVIFAAVSSEVTANGELEKAPKDDNEWAVVRKNALIMLEGANLLIMPGRHIASDSDTSTARGSKEVQIELSPAQIEAKVARDRPRWISLAQGLRSAASVALKAANAKDTKGLLAAGDRIDTACENCHLRYWYPDQTRLLDEAVRLLRQQKQ